MTGSRRTMTHTALLARNSRSRGRVFTAQSRLRKVLWFVLCASTAHATAATAGPNAGESLDPAAAAPAHEADAPKDAGVPNQDQEPAHDKSPDASDDDTRSEGEEIRETLMEISCHDEQDLPESWLDRTHSYINSSLCEPAAWFDGFFGDDRTLEETPVGTFFRWRNEARWEEADGFRMRVRLSANISLPGASERLRLLFTRDEDVRGEFDPYLPAEEGDKQTRLGLRFKVREHLASRLDVDATVRVNWGSLNPVLRGRYRYVEPISDDTQIAFWEAEEGFGTTSRADWEWSQKFDTQVRFSSQGTWSEESDGIDWRSSITRFHQLDAKTAVRAELGAFGWTQPEFETEEVYLNFRYRRTFLRPWLFYELQPEHAWIMDEDSGNRVGDWRFIVTLEIQFENKPAREERERKYLRRWNEWRERMGATDGGATPPPVEGRTNR
jgi:hypothetical protein